MLPHDSAVPSKLDPRAPIFLAAQPPTAETRTLSPSVSVHVGGSSGHAMQMGPFSFGAPPDSTTSTQPPHASLDQQQSVPPTQQLQQLQAAPTFQPKQQMFQPQQHLPSAPQHQSQPLPMQNPQMPATTLPQQLNDTAPPYPSPPQFHAPQPLQMWMPQGAIPYQMQPFTFGQMPQQPAVFVMTGQGGEPMMLAAPPTPMPWVLAPSPYTHGMAPTAFAQSAAMMVAPAVQPATLDRAPVHSAALANVCDFVPLSPRTRNMPMDHGPRYEGSYKVFVGQARHETTTSNIVELFERLAQVTPTMVRPAGKGCFITFVDSAEACRRLTMLHRRVIMDYGGAWYAAHPAALERLTEYVLSNQFRMVADAKLPKQALVVEYQPTPNAQAMNVPMIHTESQPPR